MDPLVALAVLAFAPAAIGAERAKAHSTTRRTLSLWLLNSGAYMH